MDAETPGAVYDSFARTIRQGVPTPLVGAAVGGDAPFAVDYERSHHGSETAGLEFVARIGPEVLAGKVGIDCETGELYVGAMNATAKLGRRQLCGQYLQADAKKKIVCKI